MAGPVVLVVKVFVDHFLALRPWVLWLLMLGDIGVSTIVITTGLDMGGPIGFVVNVFVDHFLALRHWVLRYSMVGDMSVSTIL